MQTERHIYDHNCKEIFYTGLSRIHSKFVDKLVMCGVGKIGANIEQVKMTRMFNTMKYLEHVMGGMLKQTPQVQLLLTNESDETDIECIITYLNNKDDVSGTYMLQSVNNYPKPGQCLYQFWQFNDNSSVNDINNVYNDNT